MLLRPDIEMNSVSLEAVPSEGNVRRPLVGSVNSLAVLGLLYKSQ